MSWHRHPLLRNCAIPHTPMGWLFSTEKVWSTFSWLAERGGLTDCYSGAQSNARFCLNDYQSPHISYLVVLTDIAIESCQSMYERRKCISYFLRHLFEIFSDLDDGICFSSSLPFCSTKMLPFSMNIKSFGNLKTPHLFKQRQTRYIVYTNATWPNSKHWLMIHLSDLVMIIR